MGHLYQPIRLGGLVAGGDIDGCIYTQRGNLPVVECLRRRDCHDAIYGGAKMLRMWGGIMDMSMDGSPIIDKTGIDQLYLNTGWCYGGFKATPPPAVCPSSRQ